MKNTSLPIFCIFITVVVLISTGFPCNSYGLDPLICHEGTIANSGRWTHYQSEKARIAKLLKVPNTAVHRTALAKKYIELHTKPVPGYGNINSNLDGNLWKIPPKGAIVKLNNGNHTVVIKDNYGRAYEMMNHPKGESKRLSESSLFDIANRTRPDKTGNAREPFKKKPVEVFEWKDKVSLDKKAISPDPKVRRQWFDKKFGVKPTSEYTRYEQLDSKIYKNGYDPSGYDREGYDKQGFNRAGIHKGTGRKYDAQGFDATGHNAQGFNRTGIHKDTGTKYNAQGYDRTGYDKRGFNKAGVNKGTKTNYDAQGYDKGGYDSRGFSKAGIHKGTKTIYDDKGYNRQGYDKDGFNRKGLDKAGYDRKGYDIHGLDRDGFDRDGFGPDGFNLSGLDRDGYDRNGYGVNGFDRDGFDRDGFGRDGFNLSGLDRDGYDRNGYGRNGYNREGFDVNGNLRREGQSEDLSKGVECCGDMDCQEGYVCVNKNCVSPVDDTYKNFGDKVVNGEIDRKNRLEDQQMIDQILIAGRDSKTSFSERVREIFDQVSQHKDKTGGTGVIPPTAKPPKPSKFKCKSNQDCWSHHKSNQYYCNKKKNKCIKCPDGSHGKKDGKAECCRDEPIPGTGGKTKSPDKFPKSYTGTILITLPGCSSSQPMTVVLEDHAMGPKNLLMYKYNLVATYGFSITYDKTKGIGTVKAKNLFNIMDITSRMEKSRS